MSLVTLKISDEVEKAYTEQNKTNPRLAMEQQLARFAHISGHDRPVVLSKEAAQRLERAYSNSIEDDMAFARWVESMGSFKVNGVDIPLSANQLKVLNQQAQYSKKPLPEFIAERVGLWMKLNLGL